MFTLDYLLVGVLLADCADIFEFIFIIIKVKLWKSFGLLWKPSQNSFGSPRSSKAKYRLCSIFIGDHPATPKNQRLAHTECMPRFLRVACHLCAHHIVAFFLSKWHPHRRWKNKPRPRMDPRRFWFLVYFYRCLFRYLRCSYAEGELDSIYDRQGSLRCLNHRLEVQWKRLLQHRLRPCWSACCLWAPENGEILWSTYKRLLLPYENTVSNPKIPDKVSVTTNIKLHLEMPPTVLFGSRLVLSRYDEVVYNFFLKDLLLRGCLQLLLTHCQD